MDKYASFAAPGHRRLSSRSSFSLLNIASLTGFSIPVCGEWGGCAGASGIGTSEKSSWATALIVHESMHHLPVSIHTPTNEAIATLTDTDGEHAKAQPSEDVFDEVWLTSTD